VPPERARETDGRLPTVGELFAEHAVFVWRLLRRLGVSEADAEDVCQDVFIVVHRKLSAFEPRASPRTWLYAIAARVASEYRRSARVRREELTDSPPEQISAEDPIDFVERRRQLAWLDAVLDELDHDKRAVFVLYEIEELSMSAVAVMLDCPLQTAYSRLYAARKVVDDAARKRAKEDGS
jgi:RNA polymerase sigma-70 factor, ECF subfamily